MNQFLWGALTASCVIAGLLLLRSWRLTRDRLFLFFACGFWALAVNWLALAVSDPASEGHHRIYFLRLIAFSLIIGGVLDKNRRRSA